MPTTTVPAGRRTLAEIHEARLTKGFTTLAALEKRAKRVRNPEGKVAQEIAHQRAATIDAIEQAREAERERVRLANRHQAHLAAQRRAKRRSWR